MGTDDSLLLGFGEDIHDAPITCGPVGFGDAVDEDDVDVVHAELFAVTVEISADSGGIACVGLGEHCDFVAWNLFECCGDIGVAAVGVGGVEEAQTVFVIAIDKNSGERRRAEPRLVGGAAVTDRSGSHGEPAGSDAGVAENDFVARLKFLREGFGVDERSASYRVCSEECSAEGTGRATKEVSP